MSMRRAASRAQGTVVGLGDGICTAGRNVGISANRDVLLAPSRNWSDAMKVLPWTCHCVELLNAKNAMTVRSFGVGAVVGGPGAPLS